MTDQDNLIQGDTDDSEGHGFKVGVTTDDDSWLKDRLGGETGSGQVILKAAADDVEGHAMGSTVALRAFEDEDDTEGHAISVHFPSREEADAFRRRLMLAGVLTGTIVLGAAGGIGLANLSNTDATGAGAATGAGSAAGMDWTQAERPDAAEPAPGEAGAPTQGGARPE
jgi:hypothetical protein